MTTVFAIVKMWKQPKCPSTDDWFKIFYIIYVYTMEYCSAIKKSKTLSVVVIRIYLESTILSEVNQIKANIILNHLYVESKKIIQIYIIIWIYISNENRFTGIENKLMFIKREKERREIN